MDCAMLLLFNQYQHMQNLDMFKKSKNMYIFA
ncbi:hypothetical protein CFSAN001690_21325 [Salmonella enterica subsp. enterica serovar Cerro str. CFSAN001690]|nr:hypothetical protein CFSAN001691_21615 [Salmonella enterica subsp. enterica serovar Cerro str. CFSAN001691]ETB75974.1 hypothetical protein CFSAN001680_21685 [Salmonella enterica subsp. enterica serovar Cerro str. CFSAN001680]ETB84847.1 hypothetical protein CFSAN001690_21325 [Salmonella enterica subsp. enterica serovar Cerro str. CFSAN001690]ETB90464.1 hypothetical protein CFSAN001674_21355 [Salmonella enterica subsp. enterica serovar Cerro str. CFSAN001674]ETB97082.1 hypothetical protein CFS